MPGVTLASLLELQSLSPQVINDLQAVLLKLMQHLLLSIQLGGLRNLLSNAKQTSSRKKKPGELKAQLHAGKSKSPP